MQLKLTLISTARRTGLATLALALAVSLAGCKDATEAAPETGVDYYPVAVGNYWTYAVADTTWSEASGQGAQLIPSVATPSAYQFKETVTEIFTDAAGKPVYRLVRSKMVPPATNFVPDSVFVLNASPQSVILTRNNRKTLELIFPVKDNRIWNYNAYINTTNDTVVLDAENRQYSQLAQPYTTGGNAGIPVKAYSNTLTTDNVGIAAYNNLTGHLSYRQVFAKGVGPIYRRRVNQNAYSYAFGMDQQVYPPRAYTSTNTRTETLIDYQVK